MFNKIVNINHIITQFATLVPCTCMIRPKCVNLGKKRTTFAEVTLKIRMDTGSRTRAWLAIILYLRRLCP